MKTIEIFTLCLICLIIFISLYLCQETFNGRVSAEIKTTDGYLGHVYFSNITNNTENNIYFLVNKRKGDNENLYFMNHEMNVVKLKKNYSGINNTTINKLALYITMKTNTNLLNFFKTKNLNLANENDTTQRENMFKLIGETFPKGQAIKDLQKIYFVRNSPTNPCIGFRLQKNENQLLIIDYEKNEFIFKNDNELVEEPYTFTFFLIPYFCPSELDPSYYSRGLPCLWRTQI